MKKRESDLLLEEMMQNYLDKEQFFGLIDYFVKRTEIEHAVLRKEKIPFNDLFLEELAIERSAYDLYHSEAYKLYKNQMLIKSGLAYTIRDFFVLAIRGQ